MTLACSRTLVLCLLLTVPALGQWSFAPERTPVGRIVDVAIGLDLDAEPGQEIVIGSGGGGLRVLSNREGHLAETPGTLLPGSRPRRLVAADVDQDGRRDLVVLEGHTATRLFVLPTSGSGFAAPVLVGTTFGAPRDVAVADVDGDGARDLVFTTGASASVWAHLGNGAGGFGAAVSLVTSVRPVSRLAVGDLDGDGVLDLVLGHDGPAQFALRPGVGGGSFGPAVWLTHPVAAALEVTGLAVADLQSDGILDVLATARVPGGAGTFILKHDALLTSATWIRQEAIEGYPVSLAVADLDGDAVLDVVVGHHRNGGAGGVRVLRGLGTGGWLAAPEPVFAASDLTTLAVADLDAGGAGDLLVAEASGTVTGLRNATVRGVLRPGTGDALELAMGVDGPLASGPGHDVHVAKAGQWIHLRTWSWLSAFNGLFPRLHVELLPWSLPQVPGPLAGLWLRPATAPLLALGGPLPPVGVAWSYPVPAGLAGTAITVQVLIPTDRAENGTLATSQAHAVRFVP